MEGRRKGGWIEREHAWPSMKSHVRRPALSNMRDEQLSAVLDIVPQDPNHHHGGRLQSRPRWGARLQVRFQWYIMRGNLKPHQGHQGYLDESVGYNVSVFVHAIADGGPICGVITSSKDPNSQCVIKPQWCVWQSGQCLAWQLPVCRCVNELQIALCLT